MKHWCEHLKDNGYGEYWMSPIKEWLFCPHCGRARPTEEKVELPEKFGAPNPDWHDGMAYKIDQLIDFLKSEPWKK